MSRKWNKNVNNTWTVFHRDLLLVLKYPLLEKLFLSEWGQGICTYQALFKQTVLNKHVSGLWCERTLGDGLLQWCMHYHGLWTWWFEIKKKVLMMDLFLTKTQLFTLLVGLYLVDWNRVDYCNVFISCLDSHSDGSHSLQMIHWRARDVMLNFSKSVRTKKQTHLKSSSWMAFNFAAYINSV